MVDEDGPGAETGEVGEPYVRGPPSMQGYRADPDRTGERAGPDPRGGPRPDPRTAPGTWSRRCGMATTVPRPAGLPDQEPWLPHRAGRHRVGASTPTRPSWSAPWWRSPTMVTNRIRAFVAVKAPIAEAEIVAFCAELIPRYMVPEAFAFREALPKTSTGKIDRQTLNTEARADG